jgi:hypothetical protein
MPIFSRLPPGESVFAADRSVVPTSDAKFFATRSLLDSDSWKCAIVPDVEASNDRRDSSRYFGFLSDKTAHFRYHQTLFPAAQPRMIWLFCVTWHKHPIGAVRKRQGSLD